MSELVIQNWSHNIRILRFLVRFNPDYRFVELAHSCAKPFSIISVFLAPIMAGMFRVQFHIFLLSVKTTEADKFVRR